LFHNHKIYLDLSSYLPGHSLYHSFYVHHTSVSFSRHRLQQPD